MRVNAPGVTVVVPQPKGGVLEKGSISSGAAYAEVASRVVTNGKNLQVSKIVVSAQLATWIALYWNGAIISCERLLDSKTVLIEHFPYDYYPMPGDGAKKFQVMAKYETAAGLVNAEISGSEV